LDAYDKVSTTNNKNRSISSQMVDLVGELNLIVNALEESGLDYALCGGIAVAIHGYPRATRDIVSLSSQTTSPPFVKRSSPSASR
jgi:hypothetical protein